MTESPAAAGCGHSAPWSPLAAWARGEAVTPDAITSTAAFAWKGRWFGMGLAQETGRSEKLVSDLPVWKWAILGLNQ